MAKDPTNAGKGSWKDNDELREALRRGNEAAWRYAYELTWPFISGYVMAQGGSEDDVKEVHQQAMTVLYEKRHALAVSPKTFTFAVAKYAWWAINKKRGKMIPYEPDPLYNENDDDNDPLDDLPPVASDPTGPPMPPISGGGAISLDDADGLPGPDEILDYIKNMGNPCRDLLLDHYIGRIPYEEIAEETQQKPGTVRQQGSRCLDKVRQHFLNRFRNQ